MDPNIEIEQAELDDTEELGTNVTYEGESFGASVFNRADTLALFGIDIQVNSVFITVVTTNVPDIANDDLIIIGDAPESYEDQAGDEEIIELEEDPVVEIMQGEYYVINIMKKFDGNPFRTGLTLSKNKGV